MKALNLPEYQFRLQEENGQVRIFDPHRKKYVVLTPEEWVRQNFIQYLISEKKFPSSLIAVEVGLKYNTLQKRADILIYDKTGDPILMVECKAPEVKITEEVFRQIAVYNMSFKVKYLVVTNGMDHYCCSMDYEANSFQFIKTIPSFE